MSREECDRLGGILVLFRCLGKVTQLREMRKYSTAAIQSFHRFVQMLLFSMIQTIAPCAARRDDHEQRIEHADFHDLPLSVSLRSEALGYFRLSQGQTPIHTKRSSFVFFCLPRSSLRSPGLCALCASVVNPFCFLLSAFCLPPSPRPRRRVRLSLVQKVRRRPQ